MISTLEKEITFRFLKARKKDGFLNVISIFSFIGISLGVAVLIIVMSVMNGFKTELTNKILGLNPHCETTDKISAEKKEIIPAINKLKKKGLSVNDIKNAINLFISSMTILFPIIYSAALTYLVWKAFKVMSNGWGISDSKNERLSTSNFKQKKYTIHPELLDKSGNITEEELLTVRFSNDNDSTLEEKGSTTD